MRTTIPLICLYAALIVVSSSCSRSADCVDLCEDRKACASASADDKAANCADLCNAYQALADKASCGSQYTAVNECAADKFDDACENAASTACDAEGKAYTDCVTPYCTDNPTECT